MSHYSNTLVGEPDGIKKYTTSGVEDLLTIDGSLNTITNVDLNNATSSTLLVTRGGTGATTASGARSNLSAANVSGDVFTGLIQFSGTTHAGIKLNALTTTERNSLTASAGMTVFNLTTNNCEFYDGSGWVTLGESVGVSTNNEEPDGDKDEINTEFTLAYTPISGSLELQLNGIIQQEGIGKDYTLSSNTITMAIAPYEDDSLIADYSH